MPRRRNGRPGLMGTMARTAVIAGTATAVSGSVADSQAQKQRAAAAQQQARIDQAAAAQVAAAQVAAPAPAAPASSGPDRLTQLQQLGELRAQGVLTEAEFAAEKARILGG